MILSDYAIRRRTTVFVLMVLCVVMGMYAYLTLPREAAPDVTIPYIMVMTVNRGVGPADMESTVTRHLEEELEALDDLKKMISISGDGISHVVLEFEPDVDVEDALRKVKDEVEKAKGDLPDEAYDPVVQEINASDFPIMVVNVHGGPFEDRQRNLLVLKKVADELQDVFEMVPGVLQAKLVGGLTPEVRIEIDPDRLAAYRVPPALLVARYMGEDVKISAGSTDFGEQSFDIRVPMEFERDIQAAENIIVHKMGDRAVYLGDLADIVTGFEEEGSFSRYNGEESVALVIQKKTGANILHTAAGVRYVIDEARKAGRIPRGVDVTVTNDVSEFIQMLVEDLDNNIFTGFFLVLGVVLVALGLRNSFFVALAIPFSFFIALSVLMLLDVTLNFVVLFSLILALGMLVDNAIVIVENIFRHQQMGHGPVEAALLGTREVAWPIVTSTFTTLAAFAPLLFWSGIMGEFMGYLPLTLIVCLSASLFVALVINPAVCAALMRVRPGQKWGSEGRELGPFLRAYRSLVRGAVRWKLTTVAISFGLLFLTVFLYGRAGHGIEFFPSTDPQQASVDITFPEGSRLERTRDLALEAEEVLRQTPHSEDVESLITSVGTRGVTQLFSAGNAPNIARLAFEFEDIEDRKGNSAVFIEDLRERLSKVAGAEVRVDKREMGPPAGEPVNIEIHGHDYALLGSLAARVKRIIRGVDGVVDVRDDFEAGRPELEVTVDRKRAALLGLSPLEAGMTLQTAYRGSKVGVVRAGDEEYDVNVIAEESERRGFAMLDKLYLTTATGRLVPASTVAQWQLRGGQGAIKKIDRDLVVTVSSDVVQGYQKDAVRKKVKEALAGFEADLPPGYSLSLTGEQEMMEEAQTFLLKAFIISIFLIAMILISQFNSLRLPFIILTSVLLSLIGVFFGLWVMGMPFGVIMTGLGVISLAGVVVNNAIVLIDYINKLRERGLSPYEAVIEAGVTRLRPVLLTAVTTIFGLVPMAVGVSFDFHRGDVSTGKEMAQFWSPMAWAVIFGLGVATFLTLVVLPSLYALLMRVRPVSVPPRGGDGGPEAAGPAPPPGPASPDGRTDAPEPGPFGNPEEPPPTGTDGPDEEDDFHRRDPFAGLGEPPQGPGKGPGEA